MKGIRQIVVYHPSVAVDRPRGKFVVNVWRQVATAPGYHQEDVFVDQETYDLLLPLTRGGQGQTEGAGYVTDDNLIAAAMLIYGK